MSLFRKLLLIFVLTGFVASGHAQSPGASGSMAETSAAALLSRERDRNLEIEAALSDADTRRAELGERNREAARQLEQVVRAEAVIAEQIVALEGTRVLSRMLQEQRAALPHVSIDPSMAARIADIRVAQFDTGQRRTALVDPRSRAIQMLADHPDIASDTGVRANLVRLLMERRQSLERLDATLDAWLDEALALQAAERELQTRAEALRSTMDERMFWAPSNRPLDLGWFAAMPALLERQLQATHPGEIVAEFGAALKARPLLFLPLILVIGALLWRRRWLYQKLADLERKVGAGGADSLWHTLKAIVLNILLALPGTLLFALAGLALQMDARGQNVSLGAALMGMAQAWLLFYTTYRLLAPGGVVERHFLWPRPQVQFLHAKMRWIGIVVLGLVAVATYTRGQPEAMADDVIGVFILLGGFIAMTWLLGSMFWHTPEGARRSATQVIASVAVTLLPLVLAFAVIGGYYFTALKLTDRLLATLALVILWLLVDALFVRGLAVAALSLARKQVRASPTTREGPDGTEIVIDEPALDVDRANQQSLRLMRLGLLGIFLVALYWVWADVIAVFTYLDTVTLYEYATGGDPPLMVPISLGDLIGALAIAVVAVVMARNLPGLLEVLVLSRLQLAQGSAYATTALLSYVIVGVGFVATLSALGVSWDKLQWLVAALSVGLGFGLQEIFANFVSGLIILFERPVRIGDVVTIDNLSGTVSRIRIRATTIIDFDRKEIIVPNKTFVTSQVTNWSLSDTVTRVIVRLGVAYGSDLDKVRALMLKIAGDNPRVLNEPAPAVLFLNFGESTLDHELRIHVRSLSDRNPAIDEINRQIDLLFREHGIEIAFRQLDVNVRSMPPQDTAPPAGAEPAPSGGAPG